MMLNVRARTICVAALGLFASLALAQPSRERSTTFGRDWVRSHPFVLMGLSLRDASPNFQQYRDAGLTYMLAWKPHRTPSLMEATATAKLPWIASAEFSLSPFDENEIKSRIETAMSQYPGNVGWLLNDEPTPDEMEITGQVAEWLRRTHPDKLIFSNVGGDPNYAQHVQNFLKHIRPDVLMFDRYPFSPILAEIDEPEQYFMQVGVIRQAALDAGIPYWAFVQSVDRAGPGFKFAFPYYSESDLRMQVFIYLTYGYSGLGYFMYDYWTTKSAPAFTDESGAATHIHRYAAKANAEARVLGEVIKHLTSTHIFAVPMPNGAAPPLASADVLPVWTPDALPENPIRAIDITEPGPDRHGLIGYFRDDAGQRFFMITNLWRQHTTGEQTGDAQETSLTFRVRFDPNVKSITRLDREMGKAVSVPIDNPDEGLLLDLPGGTGDLFSIDGVEFPSAGAQDN